MDPEKITNKFSHLDEYLKLLKQVGSTGKEDFTKDKILIGSAKYYLQVSIFIAKLTTSIFMRLSKVTWVILPNLRKLSPSN